MSSSNKQLIGSMKGLHQVSARDARRQAERAKKKSLKKRGTK
jgi:hypothetical protein